MRQGRERIRFLSTIRFPLRFTEVYKTIFKRHEIKKKEKKRKHTHKRYEIRLSKFLDWQGEKRREMGMGSRGEAGKEKAVPRNEVWNLP